MTPFLVVENLYFSYREEKPLFVGFNWQVAKGEAWAIIGPSGCGKTTLLYLLAGLLKPKIGRITVEGKPLERPRPETSLILQDHGLLPWYTIRENIALGWRIRTFYGPDGKHAPRKPLPEDVDFRVDQWLRRLGLEEVAHMFPAQTSGGQRQRAAIARSLVLEPDLLLMDEPFSALDAPTREDLEELTLQLCQETGVTLITVTHNIEEAAFLGRKILCLTLPPHTKPLIMEGPPPERSHPEYHLVCQKLRKALEESKR